MSPKPKLPKPWEAFLTELDGLLSEPIELHCIGGFALVVGYGLPRATKDLDYRTVIPRILSRCSSARGEVEERARTGRKCNREPQDW